ncbi:putative protein N(5)-glutamine methyltransferase [Nocardioides fonticola]|uniref:Methyltransferase small domain-containing protein n=1 Tax=Nocardioides fonticola TaxID=450363 RepID=A0ABP7Y3S0_9ACTN
MDDDPLTAALRSAGCVFAEEEAALLRAECRDPADLDARLARRVAGEPLEVVLGWAGFDGLRVPVAPGVFVPRRRSLLLVEVAATLARPGDVVLDLCCGTGALAAAVSGRRPDVEVWAADLDAAAVACARRHLPPERVLHGDLFAPLPPDLRSRVGVLICNAPYVPTAAIGAMPPEARDHEARHALDGGADGHEVHRRVLAEAGGWLRSDGVLLFECADTQAATLLALVDEAGLVPGRHEADSEADSEADGTVVVSGGQPA